MGGFVSKGKADVLMLGPEASGKSTALYMMQTGEVVPVIRTLGYNLETIQYRGYSITIRDIGGSEKVRAIWKYYVEGNDALIYFISSSDRSGIREAKRGLEAVLKLKELVKTPLLVFANKQDCANAMAPEEVMNALDLSSLPNRDWRVIGSSATKNIGLGEGLDWIIEKLDARSRQKPLPERLYAFCSNNPILVGLITSSLLVFVLRRKLRLV